MSPTGGRGPRGTSRQPPLPREVKAVGEHVGPGVLTGTCGVEKYVDYTCGLLAH
jgi:hypothetical protein